MGESNTPKYTGTIGVTIRGKEYFVHITPPPPMMALEDLEKGLQRNRDIIKDCQGKMHDTFRREVVEYAAPATLNYDTPTQDAIQAHINISLIIPIINLKGGAASFEKPETLPVDKRVEIMRNVAEKTFFMNQMHQQKNANKSLITIFVVIILLSLIFI